MSSHIFSEIDNTCDRIAIIRDGKIVSEFIANDLKHASKKYYTIDFATEEDKKKFLESSAEIYSLILIDDKGKEIYISIEDRDLNGVIRLLSDAEVVKFSNRKESLEYYFMKFYKEDKDFKGAIG